MKKRGLCAFFTLALLLSGCAGFPKLSSNPQDLYALPELPAKYTVLRSQINEFLSEGAEYAPPSSGTNIQAVQVVDLNGDGHEEAIAFLRSPGEEKPLKICIFQAEDDDTYRFAERIEGSGTAVYSVAYADMDGDGNMELIVGWKAAAELQVLEVYSPETSGNTPLVRTDYVRYSEADLNNDGLHELVVLRANEEGDGVADYYTWQGRGALSNTSSARVSSTMAELSQQGRVRLGALSDTTPALFVTGITDVSTALIDILAVRGSELTNITLDQSTGVSAQIMPFCSLYPTDINSDGVTEVPRPVSLREDESPSYKLIEWCSYEDSGQPSVVMRTCHDLDDGWYLRLPENWDGRINVSRAVTSGEASITFTVRGSKETPFLRISSLTGTGRDVRAARGDRFVLSRLAETIYTGELLGNWEYGMTEEQIRGAFSLILPEWILPDN